MADPTRCPPPQLLAEFGRGKLDSAKTHSLEQHLETCIDCRNVLGSLSGEQPPGQSSQPQAPAGRHGTRVGGSSGSASVAGKSIASLSSAGQASQAGNQPGAVAAVPPELTDHPDYELIRELGQGGMGIVYLARNRMMDRLEVLKVVSRSLLESPGALERFQQEIRSAAKLAHPNIVAAYTVIRPGNLLVFCMEYVDGQDLGVTVKQRGPLPIVNASFYIHQVAQGLQHAHEKGMVHRDIKPGNLMLAVVNKKHVVKILDFGLAKATSEKMQDGGLTKSGQMLGTPDYIAPEQTLDAQKADIRADIYSLGCTLYYLLSGRPPFDGASLYEILHAHHSVEARPLNLVRPEVPAELAAVVAKLMAKDPAQRYQTPAEVAQSLKPFFQAGGHAAKGDSLPPQPSPYAAPPTPMPLPGQSGVMPRPMPQPVAAPVAIAQPPAAPSGLAELDAIARPQPAAPARTTRPPRGRKVAIICAAAILGVVLAAGLAAFQLRQRDGVLALSVNEPTPEVLVDGLPVDVTWADGGKSAEIRLAPGTRKIELKKAGFELSGSTVEIERAGRAALLTRLVKLPEPAATANAVSNNPAPKVADDTEPKDASKMPEPAAPATAAATADAPASGPATPPSTATAAAGTGNLKVDGAFGFRQAEAEVLFDTPDVRLSVWNNHEYLYVQAALWNDHENELSEDRKLCDRSELTIFKNLDGANPPLVEVQYSLNPWAAMRGLYYQLGLGPGTFTGLKNDSAGRGSIGYVEGGGGQKIRIDSFAIPLAEIHRSIGNIRIRYVGTSYNPPEDRDCGMRTFRLANRTEPWDVAQVPEGRTATAVAASSNSGPNASSSAAGLTAPINQLASTASPSMPPSVPPAAPAKTTAAAEGQESNPAGSKSIDPLKFDANHDGKFSSTERSELRKAFDADHDGKLDAAELRTALATVRGVPEATVDLRVGDAAPEFSMIGTDGKAHALRDCKNKQAVVIAWYASAFAKDSTIRLRSIDRGRSLLEPVQLACFAASCDSPADNKQFAESLHVGVPLLSDPGKENARAFGVLSSSGTPLPWIFYIDRRGKIVLIDKSSKSAGQVGSQLASRAVKLRLATYAPSQPAVAAVATSTTNSPPQVPATSDPERSVAEWLLAQGDHVYARDKQTRRVQLATSPAKLPAGSFEIWSVYFRSKQVTGDHLARLAALPGLSNLHFTQCTLADGALAPLAQMPRIRTISFFNSKPPASELQRLSAAAGLKFLHLTGAGMTDQDLAPIAKCSNVTSLFLGGNQLTDAAVPALAGMSLTSLYLDDTKLTDAAIGQLKQFASLVNLGLRGTKITDAGVAQLSALKGLTSLNVGSTAITDRSLPVLQNFSALRSLMLDGTSITDAVFPVLNGLPAMAYLNLYGTKISDAGMAALGRLPNLSSINLGNTQISDHSIPALQRLTDLYDIHLEGTKVSVQGLAMLSSLPKLKYIYVGNSQFPDAEIQRIRAALPNCQVFTVN